MKSDISFDKIEFKFKKLRYKNNLFGIILLKLDETIYNCFIPLDYLKNRLYLEKLINLDYFNFIVFNKSKENKIYRILNNLKNKILLSIPDSIHISNFDYNISLNNLNNPSIAKFLWEN